MSVGLLVTDPSALGPYRLLGRLGGGGMGQVYLAESPDGGLAAVKVIRPEFAADPEFRARFTREVANARNVSGMYTALLVDADTDGPVPWLATAYIAGPPLSAAVRDSGPLPLTSLLPLATGLAKALAAIHAAGVVHRDLKPSNVLLAADGPRVIDFGISHAVEASTLTQTGAVMGSPGYMSPEQAQGRPVGPASDVFSLGAVLAFASAGAPAFGTGSVAALVYRVVSEAPELDQVPPRLRPLVEACLAKEPGDRPSLADVLLDVGGGLIRRDWLPDTVADTIARYEPAARLAAIAALDSPPLTGGPASALPLASVQAPGRTPDPLATESPGRERPASQATAAGAVAAAVAAGREAAPPGTPPPGARQVTRRLDGCFADPGQRQRLAVGDQRDHVLLHGLPGRGRVRHARVLRVDQQQAGRRVGLVCGFRRLPRRRDGDRAPRLLDPSDAGGRRRLRGAERDGRLHRRRPDRLDKRPGHRLTVRKQPPRASGTKLERVLV
jgi:hypothetical protein